MSLLKWLKRESKAEVIQVPVGLDWIDTSKELPVISHNEIILWNGKWCYVGKYLATYHGGPGAFFNPHDDLIRSKITHFAYINLP